MPNAVAHDVSTASHTAGNSSISQASFTWNHTGGGSARAVLIFVIEAPSATSVVTSVTYGGTAVPAISGASAADTATEPGRVTAYLLDNLGGLGKTGTQAVVVNRSNTTQRVWAVAITVTCPDPVIPVAITLRQENAQADANARAVDDGTRGANSLRAMACYSGASAAPGADTGSTSILANAFGAAYSGTAVRETTPGQGSRNVGVTGASDDWAAVYLALVSAYRDEAGLGIKRHLGSGVDVPPPKVAQKAGSGVMAFSAGGSGGVPKVAVKTGFGRMGAPITGGPVTKTGAGVQEHAGSGADAALWVDSGAGVQVRAGSAADAATFVESGSATSPRSGVAADEILWVDSGAGVSPRVASGASQRILGGKSGAGVSERVAAGVDAELFVEAGAGSSDRVASGVDAATFVESGSGVSARSGGGVASRAGAISKSGAGVTALSGSAADAATFVESGAGVLVRISSGADESDFIESGSAISPRSASGARVSGGGAVYTKTGFGRMGARLPISTTGAGVLVRAASGTSQKISGGLSGSGTGVSVRTGSSARAVIFSRSSWPGSDTPEPPFLEGDHPPNIVFAASGVSQKVGAANQKAGAGVSDRIGSGADAVVYAKSGAGVSARVASGQDAAAWAKTGSGVLSETGGATATKAGQNAKAGTGTSPRVAAGVDAETFVESGQGQLLRIGSAADAVTFSESGSGVSPRVASGTSTKGATIVKSGSATAIFTGGATRLRERYRANTALSTFTGGASDAATFFRTGRGEIDRKASGADATLYQKRGTALATFAGAGVSQPVTFLAGRPPHTPRTRMIIRANGSTRVRSTGRTFVTLGSSGGSSPYDEGSG